jgi:predicted transposase YdaD
MFKKFDSFTRMLLENHPLDWLHLFDLGGGHPTRVIDSNLSTLTAEADKVLWIEAPEPWIVHVEVQTSYQTDLPQRLLRYNVLLNVRHDVPVHSVAVLLFPEADGPAMNGRLAQESPDGRCGIDFRYQVSRIWQEPPETLASGIGTIALATLATPSADDMPALIDRMKAEFTAHPTREEGEIWSGLYFLIGRHFKDKELADRLLKGIQAMEDSVTYQAVIEKGRIKGLQEGRVEGRIEADHATLLRLGTAKFQAPPESVRQRILAITDPETLEQLQVRLLFASSWDDLMAETDTASENLP